MIHPDSTWIATTATPRAKSIPWLTTSELRDGVLYVATTEHKETFFQLCELANKDSGEWML